MVTKTILTSVCIVDFHVKSSYLLFVSDLLYPKYFTKNLQYIHENPSGSCSVILLRTDVTTLTVATCFARPCQGRNLSLSILVLDRPPSAGTHNPNRVRSSWIYYAPLRCYKVWLDHPVRYRYGSTGILCKTNGLLQQHFCRLVITERGWPRFG